jgi:hypothetical protein
MEKNNPVSIGDNERKFIWPDKTENSRDIILSIGAGYTSDHRGKAINRRNISNFMRSFNGIGFISKLATLRLVLQNTTDCQKMWSEFKHSLGADHHLLTKCHRINVPYGPGQTLCRLDEIDKMSAMEVEAVSFLKGKSKSVDQSIQRQSARSIDTIARQLVASLFYFQAKTFEDFNDEEYHCYGLLRCRLSPSCQAQMQSLVQSRPIFRVYEDSGSDFTSLTLDPSRWDMENFAITAVFRTLRRSLEVRIVVSMDGGSHWDDISGFPRTLRDSLERTGTLDRTIPIAEFP